MAVLILILGITSMLLILTITSVGSKPEVLIPIAVTGLITFVASAISQHRKKSKQNIADLRSLLLEEVSNIKTPPSKNRLAEFADQIGIQLDEYIWGLQKGPAMDKGLKELMGQDYLTAVELFEKNAKDHPQEAALSWFFKGNAFYFQGDVLSAIAFYQKATNFNSRLAKAWYNWGVALEALGQHKNAKLKYQKALENDPSLAEAGGNLDLTSEVLERPGREMEKFEQALELDSGYAKI
jgi:tetratricopeptide (TPR) repeat protein